MTVGSTIGILGVFVSACMAATSCSRAPGATASSATSGDATSVPVQAPSASNPAAAPALRPATPKGRSACDLVTADEASAILGESIVAKEISSDTASSFCSYAPGGDRSKEIQLKVRWTGGRAEWDTNQTAASLGGALLGADREQAASKVMKAEAVRLGDKSSYNPILGGYVLKGDVLLEFNNLLVLRDARSKWEKLAATALAKL